MDPSRQESEKNADQPESRLSLNFIVPVVSVILMIVAIIAIGIRFTAGPV